MPLTAEKDYYLASGQPDGSRTGCNFRPQQINPHGIGAFRIIAIWYVLKNCETVLDEEFFSMLLWFLEKKFVTHIKSERINTQQYGTQQSEILLYALIKWCHASCLYEICQRLKDKLRLTSSEINGPMGTIVKNRYEWRNESERAMKSLRKSPSDQKPLVDPAQIYLSSDEALDRFVLLITELQLESPESKDLIDEVLKLTCGRISDRKRTTTLNSGPSKQPGKRIWKDADTSAPWELGCLNHHVRLSAFPYHTDESDMKSVREDCSRFLLSDYTFVPSLDRSGVDMVGKWWDVEVSSVVCATLLDIRILGERKY